MSVTTDLIPRTTIIEIAAHRDNALKLMADAAEQMAAAHGLAMLAQESAERAGPGDDAELVLTVMLPEED